MNILKFIETFTDDKLYTSAGSRRESLTQFGKIGKNLALASVPLGLSTFTSKLFAQDIGPTPATPLGALQLALTLEYIEDSFYRQGLAATVGGVNLIPNADRAIIQQISDHETAHVAFLTAGITAAAGASSVPAVPPASGSGSLDFTAGGAFPDVFTNYQTFLALAQAFEDTGVRAYKGQAGNLQSSDDLLTYGLQIHSVEARHASQIRRMRNQKGWVAGDTGASNGIDSRADANYAGEGNFTQAGFNTHIATNALSNGFNGGAIPDTAGSESFDEILTTEQTVAIANLFIV